MQLLDGELVLSASDLTGFSACAHLTQLELRAARGEIDRAKRDDPMLDVLSRRGLEHETTYLEALQAEVDTTIIEIEYPDSTRAALEEAQEQTLEAMRKGVDVIYQATFFDGRWRGHADFLFRVEVPSGLCDWSYEVADAKLARRVMKIAQLRYEPTSERWTLYWADRNSRWHRYDDLEPSRNVDDLIAEIDQDPTCIFFG